MGKFWEMILHGSMLKPDRFAEIRMAEAHSTRGNGTPLINCAKEIGSDGIVMGAYSHSRLREQILGGMTYYMLNNSDVPLIMSH